MNIDMSNHFHDLDASVQERPFQGVATVVAFLDSHRGGPDEWTDTVRAFREHPLHRALLNDPYTARAFTKPRGYAGDAVMMDFIYSHPSVANDIYTASELGRGIARFSAGESDPARAVRWRRHRVAREIERLVEERGHIEVFAFACGHLREFELLQPEIRDRVRFVAADADEVSLETLRSSYASQGSVECSRTSLRELLAGKAAKLGKFDFAYTLGLLDYTTGRTSGRVVERLWETLEPGGSLLAANFTNSTRGRGYMEAAMDWWLQYRDPEEVEAWARPLEGRESAETFEDPWHQIAYLLARKVGPAGC